jgi:hypothetical protein
MKNSISSKKSFGSTKSLLLRNAFAFHANTKIDIHLWLIGYNILSFSFISSKNTTSLLAIS